MAPDFFKYLPTEITIDILLRLSVQTIAVSKCVCKRWRRLLKSDDFVSSYFAQSAPALALSVPTIRSNWLKLFDLDLENRIACFNFPYEASIAGSANGLLLLFDFNRGDYCYVCNPITREFVELRCDFGGKATCGFGVSKSGKHKVVQISSTFVGGKRTSIESHVYTLGRGSWRLVGVEHSFDRIPDAFGAFLHGNLHWMVLDYRDGMEWISCFDLKTEHFSRFTVPPLEENQDRQLYSLRDCLAFCDGLLDGCEVAIWMMKEYGVEESWTKEYVIDLGGLGDPRLQGLHPIKVLENGDVLLRFDRKLFCYSKETTSSREIGGLLGAGEDFGHRGITSCLHTPSVLSLDKRFGRVEDVCPLLIVSIS